MPMHIFVFNSNLKDTKKLSLEIIDSVFRTHLTFISYHKLVNNFLKPHCFNNVSVDWDCVCVYSCVL